MKHKRAACGFLVNELTMMKWIEIEEKERERERMLKTHNVYLPRSVEF